MKHIDIEEKLVENKSKVIKISFISLTSLLVVGLITGLTLTLVNKDKPINKSADEIRSNFLLKDAIKEIKTLDFKIQNIGMNKDDEVFKTVPYFENEIIIEGNLDSSSNKEIYYSFKIDEKENKITSLNEVETQFKNTIEKLFYHKMYLTLDGGLLYSVYQNEYLFTDKKANDSYMLFDQTGIVLEAYKEGQFQINKGVYYK